MALASLQPHWLSVGTCMVGRDRALSPEGVGKGLVTRPHDPLGQQVVGHGASFLYGNFNCVTVFDIVWKVAREGVQTGLPTL